MKALVQFEKRDGAAELRDIPVPAAGPGDVLLRVKAAGICGADLEFFHAESDNIRPPVVLGHEFCGVIEKVGAGVTEWRPGDRVVSDNTGSVCGRCHACITGNFLLCPDRLGLGYGMDGGFAEFVRIPGQVLGVHPRALMRIPDAMSFECGAVLEPAANSMKAAVQEGGVQVGDKVVVFGPGPIGLFAANFAALAGAARVVLVGGSERRLESGLRLGATDAVNHRNSPDIVAAVEQIIGVAQADVVIDAAGAASVVPDALRLIRPMGRVVKVAWTKKTPLDLNPLMFRGANVIGHFGYDNLSWEKTLRIAERKLIDFGSYITGTFNLDQWREAFAEVEAKKHIKAVFRF